MYTHSNKVLLVELGYLARHSTKLKLVLSIFFDKVHY